MAALLTWTITLPAGRVSTSVSNRSPVFSRVMGSGRLSLRGCFSSWPRFGGSDPVTRRRCAALPRPGKGSVLRVAATCAYAARTARCGGSSTEAVPTSVTSCEEVPGDEVRIGIGAFG